MSKPWDDIDNSDDLWGNVVAQDLIFAVGTSTDDECYGTTPDINDDDRYFVITPADYYYSTGAWYDQSILASFLDGIVAEEMESVFSVDFGSNLTIDQTRTKLLALGLVEEPKLIQ